MSFQLKKVLTRTLAVLSGLFIAGGLALAQNRTITGTVTDDFGEPLIGASVVVEGDTSVGAITDLDGRYSITVPASAEALRFSYIGQKDAVEQIGGRSVIDVTLASDNGGRIHQPVLHGRGRRIPYRDARFQVHLQQQQCVVCDRRYPDAVPARIPAGRRLCRRRPDR